MPLFQCDHCIYCNEELEPNLNWNSFFLGPSKKWLCRKCEERLEFITGPVCDKCGRPLDKLPKEYVQGDLCLDCVRWESSDKWSQILFKNHSFYVYNGFLTELIAQYKFRGDYELVKIFTPKFKAFLDQFEYDYLVPIPLSKERLYERGFNQAEALIKESGLEPINLLTRVHAEKQSKKGREDRIHLPQVFQLNIRDTSSIYDKIILLVDDIYTTGSTLHHAALLLKEAGAKRVSSITIARG